jgi:site-specific recombinase XerD
MNQLAVLPPSPSCPALFAPDAAAARRFVEFFTANIRNPNTRKAYARAVAEFAAWCEQNGLHELRDIEPVQVATYVETLLAAWPRRRSSCTWPRSACCSTGSWSAR